MPLRLLGVQKKVPRHFFLPPFLSGKFTLKILTLQTYLVGGINESVQGAEPSGELNLPP